MTLSDKPRRIAVIATHSPLSMGWGGIVRSSRLYLEVQQSLGWTCEVVSSDATLGSWDASSFSSGGPQVRFRTYRSTVGQKWGVGLGFFGKAWPAIASADLVLVHGCRTWPTFWAPLIARVTGKPLVVAPHGSMDKTRDQSISRKRPLLRALTQRLVVWSVRQADRLILSGEAERRQLLDELKTLDYAIIENFFSFDTGEPFAPPPSPLTYAFVGRVSPDKGILSFANAWIESADSSSSLKIIGSGKGPYFSDVMSVAERDPRISYLGELPHQEVISQIKSASVVVLPTGLDDDVTENFGNVVVEGFLSGRPAMVTRGLHWDEYDSSGALYFFERDRASVQQCVLEFERESPAERLRRCIAAKALAAKFNVASAIPKVRALFDEVVGARA